MLIIPVGGFFTIDGRQAAEYIKTIAPKVAVPMHYRGASFGYGEIGTLGDFTKYVDFPVENIGSELEVGDLPGGTRILIMAPYNA